MTGYDEQARARRVEEPQHSTGLARSDFQRDRARVLHSSALRRLAAKTQVELVGEDDFPRTRLTHSLECAQIGRELGARLGCDPDLVDAACLAHDIGHPPFGHNGETALDEAARPCGGFEGNAQTLRILTRLEPKVLDADGRSAGLNLTRATLDAATKYPWPRREGSTKFGVYEDDAAAFSWLREGAPEGRRCLETQVMDWADDIAYSVHDLEDGVYAGHIALDALSTAEERALLCVQTAELYSTETADDLRVVLDDLLTRAPFGLPAYDGSLRAQVALKRLTSELIARFVSAAIEATRAQAGDGPLSRYDADLTVPRRVRAECALLKAVAYRYVMSTSRAVARNERQRELVLELVAAIAARAPAVLDRALQPSWEAAGSNAQRLRVVVDQVARLTDVSIRAWHHRLVGARAG